MVVWLFEVVYYLMKECPSIDVGMDRRLESLITQGIIITVKYFEDMLDTRCCANMCHFVQHKGLHVLMEVLALTQKVQWSKSLVKLKQVQLASIFVIQRFTLHYSSLILECKGLERCITSLMHIHLEKHSSIADIQSPMQHRHDDLLAFVVVRSLMILSDLCDENLVCRLEIAANPSVLLQVLNISTAVPKNENQMFEMGIQAPRSAVALLLGMSYSIATHKHLTNRALIEAIMESSRMERPWCRSDHKRHLLVIRYLSCMLLAQLVLMSLKEIPPSLYQPILSFMEEFLLTPNYIADAMQEVNGFVWTTFLPHVRLLYTQEEEIERASALKLCSLEIVLLGLHSMLRRKNHCMVILNEGLVDYIVCLPSHVPETLRSKAQGLIQLLSSEGNIAVHPPRLINLAKAKLAKMYFGLEFVHSTPINEIMKKILLHNVCE
eukprot:Em0198g6a